MIGVSAMNGTFAVLTFALGMYDAHTGCDSGCLSRVEADARVNVSSGVVHFVGDLKPCRNIIAVFVFNEIKLIMTYPLMTCP